LLYKNQLHFLKLEGTKKWAFITGRSKKDDKNELKPHFSWQFRVEHVGLSTVEF